jgi:hypothetical protein
MEVTMHITETRCNCDNCLDNRAEAFRKELKAMLQYYIQNDEDFVCIYAVLLSFVTLFMSTLRDEERDGILKTIAKNAAASHQEYKAHQYFKNKNR